MSVTSTIFKLIEAKTDITEKMIKSSRKSRSLSHSRCIFSYIMRGLGYSYPAIGGMIGKNHATILLGVRRLENLPEEKQTAENILLDIKSNIEQPPILLPSAQPNTGLLYEKIRKNKVKKSQKWQWLFDRYKAICQVCGTEDIVEVHHIIPLKNGGSEHPTNLLILCPNHHTMLHAGLICITKIPEKIDCPREVVK